MLQGKRTTWLFDLDYLTDSMNYQPMRSENQANKHAGPQEANQNAGTKENIDAGDSPIEAESAQDYFVLPIWSSYTSTVKSSKASEEPTKHPDFKQVDKEDQVFLDELERLKRQEQDANDAAEALRKEFAQETKDLLLQAGAAKASSTNIVNTASTPVSTASPYGGLSFTDLTNTDQDDSEIPALEDNYDNLLMKLVVNVSPIPTSRINSIHPSTLILGDPQSAVQTRSKVTKSSGAHAFVRITAAFKIQKVWILVDLPYGKKAIGTKWVYRNKKDERGVMVRNKARFYDPKYPIALQSSESSLWFTTSFPGACQDKYVAEILKKFNFVSVKTASTPIKTQKPLVKDEEASNVDSMLVLEAEYVAAANCCGQSSIYSKFILSRIWFNFMNTKIYIDNESTIRIVKNLVYHFKTKHIAIRHHFIRDAYEKKLIQVLKIHTDDNVADLLTKAFDVSRSIFTITLQNKEIVDSGCSKNMTGNKAYLAKYQDFNGGPVDFGGSKGYITGKGKIKTRKLDFEDVCFVKELQHFNLFSVSQMCDKKNKVLFTDTECLVLSPEFNVPSGGLACLIAKATIDESNKWHRRLGHVNFKNLNKLVKENLVEQFWMSAKSKIINNIRYVTAKVAGKHVSISEASIRSDLLFDDANGIDSLSNQVIFDAIQLMGHLDSKKKFVMYPRFISVFLDKQLMNVPVPLDHFPVNALTSKVFSFMVKKGKHFSGTVTPLFASMLVQPTEDEGATLERPYEPQPTPSPPHPSEVNVEPQSDPSPRSSPTTHIPDSIPENSGGIQEGQSSSDKSLSGNEGDMTLQSVYDLCISLCTQSLDEECILEAKIGRQEILEEELDAKGVLVSEEKETADDAVRTEDVVSTDKEKVSTDRSKVSTDRSRVSTDKEEVITDKCTDDQTEGRSDTLTTQTPTLITFGNDKTIAQVLIIMSQNKERLKEKEKGVELKDAKETERPRPTSTRSLLTLNPLPKINPKDKGKKKIEEEDESETESEGIPEAEKKFKQLARDEEMAGKVQEDWEAEEEEVKKLVEEEAIKAALSNKYDFIQVRIEADRLLALRLQDEDREQFTVEERAKFLHDTIAAQRRIKKKVAKETPKTEDTTKVPAKVDVTEQGTKKRKGGHMKMLARKRKRPQSDVDSDVEHRKCLKIVTFEGTIDSKIMERKSVIARLDKVSSPDGDYLVIYRANGNFRAFNCLLEDDQQDWEIVTWRLYEACGVYILELKDGTVIHMLVERRYPLSKDSLQRMLDLGLEVERESTAALDLIRFIKQQIDEN
ncbi:putative ribonuclease H-like domain-containing protein [Tanacetum coccineum]